MRSDSRAAQRVISRLIHSSASKSVRRDGQPVLLAGVVEPKPSDAPADRLLELQASSSGSMLSQNKGHGSRKPPKKTGKTVVSLASRRESSEKLASARRAPARESVTESLRRASLLQELHATRVLPPNQSPEFSIQSSIQENFQDATSGNHTKLNPVMSNQSCANDLATGSALPEYTGGDLEERENSAGIEINYLETGKFDPEVLMQEMFQMEHRRASERFMIGVSTEGKHRLTEVLKRFAERGWAADQAIAIYIHSRTFPMAAARFRRFVSRSATPSLFSSLRKLGPSDAAEELLFPIFAEFCFIEFGEEIRSYRQLVTSADMTRPHTWFPLARAMRREIVYHAGPTNSGKTYSALQGMKEAGSGSYCGPLRLLAVEVYDRLNQDGIYCNLVTGQERKEMPFAEHTSCTVEMADISKEVDVGVVDEIQMITDPYRGWAWSRSFLGLQAQQLHVCGDPSVIPLLSHLCEATGDDFREQHYERFMPLKVAETSLGGDLSRVQPGDCVVAFSRREIFQLKQDIEHLTPYRCCVIYGALPPETRRQQAQLFNDPTSPYQVLVASDAIGMGLNLNIRRVVFSTLHKFNGEDRAPIPAPMVKQIAGRAGRRGSSFPHGLVTTLLPPDLPLLLSALEEPVVPAHAAGLFPFFEQVELFASQLPDASFAALLEKFMETTRVDGSYFMCSIDQIKRVAKLLHRVPGLSLRDRFSFCFSPANISSPLTLAALLWFAHSYAQGRAVRLRLPPDLVGKHQPHLRHLENLELQHQVASLYLWLSQHLPCEKFPDAHVASAQSAAIAEQLTHSLLMTNRRRRETEEKEGSRRGAWTKGSDFLLKSSEVSIMEKKERGNRKKGLQVEECCMQLREDEGISVPAL